jgi:hypothetical protein
MIAPGSYTFGDFLSERMDVDRHLFCDVIGWHDFMLAPIGGSYEDTD